MTLNITQHKEGVQFSAAILPRASKNEISGVMNGALENSPDVAAGGGCRQQSLHQVSRQTAWSISVGKIDIVGGLTSKNKIIRVKGMDETQLLQKILPGKLS